MENRAQAKNDGNTSTAELLNTLYKTDSARLTAILLRLLGTAHIDLVQDIVQDSFEKALLKWKENSVPENPSAWLISTAKNRAIDVLRNNKVRAKYAETLSPTMTSNWTLSNKVNEVFDSPLAAPDEQLRLLIWLASSDLQPSYLLPVMLKLVCGLSINAVARALLITESNANKRITRGCQQLKSHGFNSGLLGLGQSMYSHLNTSLYLRLNTSHHAHKEQSILCIEALNLATFVLTHKTLYSDFTQPLVALMHFYLARQPARFNQKGEPIALHLQDRNLWRNTHLKLASMHLSLALDNAELGTNTYLYEAMIAHEHMRALQFEDTDWKVIIKHYRHWFTLSNSPMVAINLAIAQAHDGQIKDALALLSSYLEHKHFVNSYQVHASLAYVHALGDDERNAQAHMQAAQSKSMPNKAFTALKKQLTLLQL